MLQELRIRNLAIIEALDLPFTEGLNILTGETGAGKSIILNAVHLLLGDRATEEIIRSSEEEASIEALFDISKNDRVKEILKSKGLEASGKGEEDCLLVKRTITRAGRGRTLVNGNLATLGALSEVGEELLSLCGQHEHQSLRRTETHVDFLDEFGGLGSLRRAFHGRFLEFTSITERIRKAREEKERRAKERELLAFQSREIEEAGLQAGEEETLKEERKILLHARKLLEFAEVSEGALYGEEGSAVERIQAVLRQGRDLISIDPSLSDLVKTLEPALIQLEEAALSLRSYSRRMELNPARLEAVESRLEEVEGLKRKYGGTVAEILRFKEEADRTLASIHSDEEALSQQERSLKALEEELLRVGRELSGKRRRASGELKRAVERELASLGMKKTVFDARIDDQSPAPKGMDRVEFLLSPNVGEEVRPLAKIASGGELSRIMLALKKVLVKAEGRQVLVFDEVDSGIGGATAEVVGRKLRDLSKNHQIICVTHLPQIACFADAHQSVRKETKGGRTITVVDQLKQEKVVDEIARMLGGLKLTDKTRAHAKEMIDNARKAV